MNCDDLIGLTLDDAKLALRDFAWRDFVTDSTARDFVCNEISPQNPQSEIALQNDDFAKIGESETASTDANSALQIEVRVLESAPPQRPQPRTDLPPRRKKQNSDAVKKPFRVQNYGEFRVIRSRQIIEENAANEQTQIAKRVLELTVAREEAVTNSFAAALGFAPETPTLSEDALQFPHDLAPNSVDSPPISSSIISPSTPKNSFAE